MNQNVVKFHEIQTNEQIHIFLFSVKINKNVFLIFS